MQQNYYYCYVLDAADCPHTYAGYTVDPARRLRQHNGELAGGARATTRRSSAWRFAFVVGGAGLDSASTAMSLEWHLKCRHRRPQQQRGGGGSPVQRRVQLLATALANPKFARCLEAGLIVSCADACRPALEAALAGVDGVTLQPLE